MEVITKEERDIIIHILNMNSTYERIIAFKNNIDKLKGCRIFLFDEKESNVGKTFGNYEFGKCGIYSIGDYTKTWIIDSEHISDLNQLCIGKAIDFDLNILTYLNRILQKRSVNIDKRDFIEYINYIKTNGFRIDIYSAMMERVKTPINLNIFAEMITSFVRLDNMTQLDENNNDFYLSQDDWKRVKSVFDIALQYEKCPNPQYDALCCCIMKAFLIKNFDKSLKAQEKVEHLIRYCLDELKCYIEKEIVLLSLYLLDDNATTETFKKLNKRKNIIKNIYNVAWDIYHIRLIEQVMLYDNMRDKNQIILSYFGTADKGLIDAININPLKAVVIFKEQIIPIHKMNIQDVCQNEALLKDAHSNVSIRANEIKLINFFEKRKELEQEILKKTGQSS
ncbi:MAG: hypothetical protein HDT34_03305 [Clostridiales bacterium]|nr:hypothetical protein [Clostridiales bacterium]